MAETLDFGMAQVKFTVDGTTLSWKEFGGKTGSLQLSSIGGIEYEASMLTAHVVIYAGGTIAKKVVAPPNKKSENLVSRLRELVDAAKPKATIAPHRPVPRMSCHDWPNAQTRCAHGRRICC